MHLRRFSHAVIWALILTSAASADVAAMRELVSRRPELVHHWTFEGKFPRDCMTDRQCSLRLRCVELPRRNGAEPLLSGHGPDATSRCLRMVRTGSKSGIVAETVEPVSFQREGTLELLFCADDIPPGEFNKGWMAFAQSMRGNRMYLAGVSRFRDVDELIAGFGTAAPFHPKAEVVIARQNGDPGFRKKEWHYLAVTYSHNRRSGEFLINAFVGPLGVERAQLSHSVKNAKRPGADGDLGRRTLHIGCASSGDQILDGAVDEIAFYDRPLTADVLRKHYAALCQPVRHEKEIDLMLSEQAPLYRVSEELARRHSDAYTKEWQCTSPDLVVFIPDAQRGPETDNQHFIVFPLASGDFLAIWTSAYHESHPNQHILASKSTDRGVTWSPPVTIAGPKVTEKDGEKTYEGLASWAFPVYVPEKNRIYVFYQKGIGVFDPSRGLTGEMRFAYTEDDGKTWSKERTVPMRRPAIAAPDPKIPPNWIIWQQPVRITPDQVLGCGTIWASKQRMEQDKNALGGSECWFWRFDNILTEDDPEKIKVTMLPDGDHGIRMPNADGSRSSTAEEPTVVRLSDGRWFCAFRTYRGCVGYSISKDEGHSWSEAKPLLYRDGAARVLQPTASCPLYPLSDGRFLLTFHNNDGTANGGKHPWDWRHNRTPAFYSVGKEMLDKEQPVWFTRPIMFLDNEAKPWGPTGRVSVAVYTSFFEFEGKRWYWYPDRKHFLLGKFITDEMLRAAEGRRE